MNYQETLDYLFSQLPMFQRIGAAAYKADLSKTLAVCEMLGHPEKKFKSVHIAGTNGKGSVSSMLASIFQQAGYKTGLYTSPHLVDFRERIKINGKMIPEQEVISFVEDFRSEFEPLQASFFEIISGMAFHHFAKEKVDIAILETGMGGRLDSTNVVDPELSVITNIGYDHTQFLGESLEKIAVEKAGIIKPQRPVVIGPGNESLEHIFQDIAESRKAPIYFVENKTLKGLETDLGGIYQQKNSRTVKLAARLLNNLGWDLDEEAIFNGAKNVIANTGLRGRWEILRESNPKIICDVGHNEDGIKEVVKMLKTEAYNELHVVWGMVNDKDLTKILPLLPKNAHYYFSRPNIPRGLDQSILKAKADDFNLSGEAYPTVKEALEVAKATAGNNDLIFVGGSIFVVAETLA